MSVMFVEQLKVGKRTPTLFPNHRVASLEAIDTWRDSGGRYSPSSLDIVKRDASTQRRQARAGDRPTARRLDLEGRKEGDSWLALLLKRQIAGWEDCILRLLETARRLSQMGAFSKY